MRRRPRAFAFLSGPVDTPTLSPFPTLPLAHRLGGNNIGAEGATALAAILKETQITNLGCAPPPHRVFAFLSAPTDKKANTLWQPIMHLSDISCPCDACSVGNNNITGDAANHLVTVVLEHVVMTDFCGIPLASLRENSPTELNLRGKGVGGPGAIVLSKLLPSAAALTSLKCAQKCLLSCQWHAH